MQGRKLIKAVRIAAPLLLVGLAGCGTVRPYAELYGDRLKNEPRFESRILSREETKRKYTKVTDNLNSTRMLFINYLRNQSLNPWELQDILKTPNDNLPYKPISAYHAVYSADGSFAEIDLFIFKDSKESREHMRRDMALLYSDAIVNRYNKCKHCFVIKDVRHNALAWVSGTFYLKLTWQKDSPECDDISNLIHDYLEKYPPGA